MWYQLLFILVSHLFLSIFQHFSGLPVLRFDGVARSEKYLRNHISLNTTYNFQNFHTKFSAFIPYVISNKIRGAHF